MAVALALQEPLASFVAGLFLALAGQIRLGDYVRLDSGQEGYVVDFSWRSSRLRMLANNKRLHARFHQEGIVIPFPIRTLTQREAPSSAVSQDVTSSV